MKDIEVYQIRRYRENTQWSQVKIKFSYQNDKHNDIDGDVLLAHF